MEPEEAVKREYDLEQRDAPEDYEFTCTRCGLTVVHSWPSPTGRCQKCELADREEDDSE